MTTGSRVALEAPSPSQAEVEVQPSPLLSMAQLTPIQAADTFLLRVFQSLFLCECLFVSRHWHQHGLFPACSSSSPIAEVTDTEQGTGPKLVLTRAWERRGGSWWILLPLLGKKTCQVNGDPLKEQHSVPQAMTSIQRKRART